MKLNFATIASVLLIAVTTVRADITAQNWTNVTGAKQSVFSIGHADVDLRPVEPAKPKDPPSLALFIADQRVTKTPIYPGKLYHFAVISTAGKSRIYINGQAEGEPLNLDLKAGDEKAITPEKNLADFKAGIASRVHHDAITVGHRGDNKGSPENTNISYVNAIANKTPIVEMDLRLTKDNVLVLMHDPTVNRTTNGKGPIVDITLADAEKLDAGSWKNKTKYAGERIPTVETICQTCRGKAVMMLDLKCTGLGESLAALKKKLDYPSDGWILAPWEDDEGAALHKHLPADIPMIRLTSKIPTEKFDDAYFSRMKQIGFTGFSVNWQYLSAAFIDAAHAHGFNVYAWTVNEPIDIAGAVLNGVDGIITDDAPTVMKLVGELKK
jgi:glycerophosphoryl diester phosphodiesterase